MNTNDFLCGVVEGFYGRPWSAAQRRQLFSWMRAWGLNTYLYAPKDDLKHRALWRALYDESEAAEMKALIGECQGKGVRFIHALAPGLAPECSRPADLLALRGKVRQLAALGCTHFALLFDDIVTLAVTGPLRLPSSVAEEQIAVAHEVLACLRETAPAGALLFCPTPYCGRMAGPLKDSDYLRRLGDKLDSSVQVLWTGSEIISETITSESIRGLASVIGRKPVLWDNLHANDYDLRRLYLGPYSGRPLELKGELGGVLSNPNCEFEANFIPIRTLAMWAKATGKWEPGEAYLAALKEWLPAFVRHDSTGHLVHLSERELRWLCDCFYLPFRHGERAINWLADFQSLLRTPPSAWAGSYERCLGACVAIELIFSNLAALRDRDLLYALYRHVWELKEEMHLLLNYLHWLRSKPGLGDVFTSAEHRPRTYRGGFVAELQRLLPMNESGEFNHRPSLFPKDEPNPYR